jgi:opacity protein-like surface antigen
MRLLLPSRKFSDIHIMKNSILLAILIFGTLICQAQNFEAFLIGGVNLSQIDGDKLAGYNKVGFVVGGATSITINEEWDFQQEIVYYQRGSKATADQLSIENFSIKRLDYIDIIAQVKYDLEENLALLGGLGYGTFVKVKSDVPEDKSLYNPDIFATFGVQYQLADNLFIALKGQYSLNSVFKPHNAYNNSLSLSLRYRLFQ